MCRSEVACSLDGDKRAVDQNQRFFIFLALLEIDKTTDRSQHKEDGISGWAI
jgi:hypothetical protein